MHLLQYRIFDGVTIEVLVELQSVQTMHAMGVRLWVEHSVRVQLSFHFSALFSISVPLNWLKRTNLKSSRNYTSLIDLQWLSSRFL